jgi:virulence-associated protein VagC
VSQTAKVIQFGPFQAVCVPPEFWLGGGDVRIERCGQSILITPLSAQPMARALPIPIARPLPGEEIADAGMSPFEKRRRNAAVTAEVLRTMFLPPANDNHPRVIATPAARGRGVETPPE